MDIEKAITEGIVFKGGKSPSGKQEDTLLIIKQLSSPLFWNYSFLYKICCKT